MTLSFAVKEAQRRTAELQTVHYVYYIHEYVRGFENDHYVVTDRPLPYVPEMICRPAR